MSDLEIDFPCKICGTSYKNEVALVRHFKTKMHLRKMTSMTKKSNGASENKTNNGKEKNNPKIKQKKTGKRKTMANKKEKEKNILSPEKNIFPPEKNIFPPEKNILPPEKNIFPPEKNILPPEKNILSPEKSIFPPEKTIGHHQEEIEKSILPPEKTIGHHQEEIEKNILPPEKTIDNYQKKKEKKVKDEKGSIYLLREREFIRLQEPTYKIGRTSRNMKQRFRGYPKGSELIVSFEVKNSRQVEKELICMFKVKFIQKVDYGDEYFNGNVNDMLAIMEDYSNGKDISSGKSQKIEPVEKKQETVNGEKYYFYLLSIAKGSSLSDCKYRIGFTDRNLECLKQEVVKKFGETHIAEFISKNYYSDLCKNPITTKQEVIGMKEHFYTTMVHKYGVACDLEGYIASTGNDLLLGNVSSGNENLLYQLLVFDKIKKSYHGFLAEIKNLQKA
jgi:hypothetical protein